MFKGTKTNFKKGFRMQTGLGAVRPLIANPTKEQVEKLTEREAKFIPKSDLVDLKGSTFRPINILCELPSGRYEYIRFMISNDDLCSKSGKCRFTNDLGEFTYYLDSIENISPNYTFNATAAPRKMKIGEEEIYTFLQKLVGYSSRNEEANWAGDCSSNEIDMATLYDGHVDGLNRVLQWANKEDKSVVTLLTAREYKGKEGEPKYAQSICNKPELFFYSDQSTEPHSILNSSYKRMKESIENSEKTGYPIVRDYYTYVLQDFTLEDCNNYKDSPEDVFSKEMDKTFEV